MTAAMARIWERRYYWLWPLALAVLLVVFLIQRLWIDSVIVGVLLAGFLGFLAVLRADERKVLDLIEQSQEEGGE